MNSRQHIEILDVLRAVASLSVCLYHFICTVIGLVDNEIIKSIFSVGHLGVQIFFVISGFVIPWSLYHSGYNVANFFRFIAKRVVRLEPPYLVALGLAIGYSFLRLLSPNFNGVDTTPTATQALLHIGYLIPFTEYKWIQQVYWTLAIEFQYYLLVGLLYPLLVYRKHFVRFACYAFMLGIGFLVPEHLFIWLPVFLLGILVFLLKSGHISKEEFAIVGILSMACIFPHHAIGVLIVAPITAMLILLFPSFKLKGFNFLGNISYSLYLLHSITGTVVLNYVANTLHHPLLKLLAIVFALAFSIFSSWLMYRFVELPSKKLSSRISVTGKKRKLETSSIN